jgi:hypothetical protein
MLSVPLQLTAGDERHRDERLGLDRRAGHEAHARVEMGLVREDGFAMVDGPAGDPSPNENDSLMTSSAQSPRGEDGAQLALRLVGLVDVHVLVGMRTASASAMRSSSASRLCSERTSWKISASLRYGSASRSRRG